MRGWDIGLAISRFDRNGVKRRLVKVGLGEYRSLLIRKMVKRAPERKGEIDLWGKMVNYNFPKSSDYRKAS